ncbi:MAG: methionyl-tRNA formyltransferase, partial [Parcubacteria group bacterium]|nr:methionyl-tRNA formyltransferase [Parcubacteria group bacterium]
YIFFGSSEFAQIILKELLQTGMKPALVITQPPKPKGRKQILAPSLVQITAEQNQIPVLKPEKLDEESFLLNIRKQNPDFALLTAYGKIIPSVLLSLPQKGFLNLHPSLLPKFRGATPIQSVILEGEKETGVTLIKMDEQIDHGPIIANSKFQIPDSRFTYDELSQQLAKLGAKLILDAIPQWLEGKIIPQPQNDALATYCHKITKEDEKIHWHHDVHFIDRQVRALNPNPGVFTICQNKIIKILQGSPLNENLVLNNKQVGEFFETPEHKLAVQCQNGVYQIDILKPEGKKEMSSQSFLKGNKWILGQIAQ